MTAAIPEVGSEGNVPVRAVSVVFWVLCAVAITAGSVAIYTVTDLYHNLHSARLEVATARKQVTDFNARLSQAEGDIGKLCKTAKKVNANLARPNVASALETLGPDFLNDTGLLKTISCRVDARKEGGSTFSNGSQEPDARDGNRPRVE